MLMHNFVYQSSSSFWGPERFWSDWSTTHWQHLCAQSCLLASVSALSEVTGSNSVAQKDEKLAYVWPWFSFSSWEQTKSCRRGRFVWGQIGISTICPAGRCHSMVSFWRTALPSPPKCPDNILGAFQMDIGSWHVKVHGGYKNCSTTTRLEFL